MIETILALSLASSHIDPAVDFEEVNPGAALGFRHETTTSRSECEVGGYRNSYSGPTVYGTCSIEVPLRSSVWGGAFWGAATYLPDQVSPQVPTVSMGRHELVPLGGLQVTFDISDNAGLRFRGVPGDGKYSRGVVTLQLVLPLD